MTKKKCYRCEKRKDEGEEVHFLCYADYVRLGDEWKKLFIRVSKWVWLCNDCLKQVEKNRK